VDVYDFTCVKIVLANDLGALLLCVCCGIPPEHVRSVDVIVATFGLAWYVPCHISIPVDASGRNGKIRYDVHRNVYANNIGLTPTNVVLAFVSFLQLSPKPI
jgi:hypothetical protein